MSPARTAGVRRRLALVAALAAAALGGAPAARAQEVPMPGPPPAQQPLSDPQLRDKLMLMRRVEALVGQGRVDEAVKLLEDERAKGPLDDLLERRLINLYRDAGLNAQLETLLAERVKRAGRQAEMRDLRMLGEAQFAQAKNPEALKTFQRIIDMGAGEPAVLEMVSKSLAEHGEHQRALQVLLDGRKRLKRPDEFAQQIGALYAHLNRATDATREYLEAVVQTPANLALVRGPLMELADDAKELPGMVKAAEAAVARHPQVHHLKLLLAELRQRAGDPEAAWAALQPLVGEGLLVPELLQMSLAALGDSRLADVDPRASLASLRLSERTLQALLSSPKLTRAQEPRLYDALNRVLLAVLEHPEFQRLPAAQQGATLAAARTALSRMAQRNPDNPMTNAALLRLAQFYVSSLHQPREAIELYRRLSLNPNAGREEVQLARVGLGTAYIAAGDTAAARELFTAMGKDMGFVEGQGRAHYHLGMLDFMGGHFKTAQDRLAAVALEAASAEYTNDALDLALILAEEQMGATLGQTLSPAPPQGGEHPLPALRAYGRSLYHVAVAQLDSAQADLQSVAATGSMQLRGRAYLDLARLLVRAGRMPVALAELDTCVRAVPQARAVPAALELKGDLLRAAGDLAGAAAAYEAVLAGHEDYTFLETVREKARALRPQAAQGAQAPPRTEKGDLP